MRCQQKTYNLRKQKALCPHTINLLKCDYQIINNSNLGFYPYMGTTQPKINYQMKKKKASFDDASALGRSGCREFEAFTLASSKANIVPVWNMMLVNAYRARTGIRASIEL